MQNIITCASISNSLARSLLGFAILVATTSFDANTARAELLASPENWQQLHVPNQPAAKFAFINPGNRSMRLTVRTDKSVAFLYREVKGEKSRFPKSLSWQWHLDQDFSHTDLTIKGKDDRPLAVHLWFSDPDQPSVFGPLGWVFGYPHITHTLTYVLGGEHRPGSVFSNPYYDKGAILVLLGKRVATDHWYTELRDIKRDIEASFPEMPVMKTLNYIAISADTDDRGGDSVARMTDLRLSGEKNEKTP